MVSSNDSSLSFFMQKIIFIKRTLKGCAIYPIPRFYKDKSQQNVMFAGRKKEMDGKTGIYFDWKVEYLFFLLALGLENLVTLEWWEWKKGRGDCYLLFILTTHLKEKSNFFIFPRFVIKQQDGKMGFYLFCCFLFFFLDWLY